MKPVAVSITSSNGCTDGACAIVSVTNHGNDSVAGGDAVITGALSVSLKGVRGSVYTVTLQCTDSFGDLSTKSVTVSAH